MRPKNTQPASHRASQGRVDSASPDTGQHEMGGARLYGQPTTSPNTGLWSRNARTPIGKAIVQCSYILIYERKAIVQIDINI